MQDISIFETREVDFELLLPIKSVKAVQGDYNTRFLNIICKSDGIPMDLTGYTVRVNATKRDDTKIYNDLEVVDASKGHFLLDFTNQMLAMDGILICNFSIEGEDSKLSSNSLAVVVYASNYDGDGIKSANEFTAFENFMKSREDLSSYVTEEELIDAIAKVEAGDVDLSAYALKSEIPTDIVTEQELLNAIAGIEAGDVDLSAYALKTDLSSYALKNDLSAYALKSELFSGNYNDLTNKPTIPTVPTKLSAFTNDSAFITKGVSDLTNYYNKTNTYTKQEVNTLIDGITSVSILIVQSLPVVGESNIIYFVPKNPQEQDNIYDEYIYISGTYEHIGDTDVDLTGYYTSSQVDNLLGSYTTTSYVDGLIGDITTLLSNI